MHIDVKFTEHNKVPDLIVRVLSPLGTYPSKSIIMPESAFIADKDICFSISNFEMFNVEDEDYYSEMVWAKLEEIRLFASVLLSSNRDEGYTRVYPFPFSEGISVSGNIDFNNTDLLKNIKELFIKKIDAPDVQIPGYPQPQRNLYRNLKGISLPPSNGGPNYDFRENVLDFELLSKVYVSINKNDHLVIRGLSTLIKSVMLNTHHQFFEESITTLYIALEASYRLVLRALKHQGIKNPSSSDAMKYIHDAFNDIYRTEKYFEEYYEDRIRTVHPESRFRIFPHAPLMVDDFYDLKDDLVEVYLFLLTGYVNPRHENNNSTIQNT